MPSFTPELVAHYFRDPDSGQCLLPVAAGYSAGGRIHALQRPNLLELMPSQPSRRPPSKNPLVQGSIEFYEKARAQTWAEARHSRPWGRLHDQPRAIQQRFGLMRKLVEDVLPQHADSFLDISAGAGAISAGLVSRYRQAFFADLMPAAAWHLAERSQALVVRADYLQSPYAPGVFDVVLCTDTLIYGQDHEQRLLQVLWQALAPGGTALLSFHHRWHHNPLTPPVVVGYSWDQVRSMLSALSPRPNVRVHKYHQEDAWPGGRFWRWALPCTRFYVELRKP